MSEHGVRPREGKVEKESNLHIGEMREIVGKQHAERWERPKTERGWMRRRFHRQRAAGRGRGKGRQRGGKGWGVASSPLPSGQNQMLLLDSMPACAGTRMRTCVHACACLSTVAWIGVNKSAGWFNNSRGDVTGKREGKSRLFLAGCGYLCLTRPARHQALCR